jgi:uncharacterized surface protein with fasciclin (FAS1) repeats
MRKSLLAGIAVAALALSGCAAGADEAVEEVEEVSVEETETTEEATTEEEAPAEDGSGTIVDVAVANGSFETLVAAVQAAGLVDTLSGEGPFTVFAPTDEAFAALPEGLVDALLLPENIEVLKTILTYHVVSGAVFAADVTTGDVATVESSTIALEVSDAGVTVNGANVVTADVEASNGVIHVIDQVLVPASVDVAALLG